MFTFSVMAVSQTRSGRRALSTTELWAHVVFTFSVMVVSQTRSGMRALSFTFTFSVMAVSQTGVE